MEFFSNLSSDKLLMAGLIIGGLISLVALICWNNYIRRVPLAEFDIDAVQRVLKYESESYRDMIWQRGWMTSHEWISINKRQIAAIEAEMRRRGIK